MEAGEGDEVSCLTAHLAVGVTGWVGEGVAEPVLWDRRAIS